MYGPAWATGARQGPPNACQRLFRMPDVTLHHHKSVTITLVDATGPCVRPSRSSGQGTIALEFLQQVPQLDAIVVPISGGGMISGAWCDPEGGGVLGLPSSLSGVLLGSMLVRSPLLIRRQYHQT
eukprot:365040-Chlamydomonas_euryale.AAC.2